MLYDIPGPHRHADRTETLVRLAEHERIVAVKDAKGDLAESAWVTGAPTSPTTPATTSDLAAVVRGRGRGRRRPDAPVRPRNGAR